MSNFKKKSNITFFDPIHINTIFDIIFDYAKDNRFSYSKMNELERIYRAERLKAEKKSIMYMETKH